LVGGRGLWYCDICLEELQYVLNVLLCVQEDILYVFFSFGMGCRVGFYDVSYVCLTQVSGYELVLLVLVGIGL
jgi:hypothetical protein